MFPRGRNRLVKALKRGVKATPVLEPAARAVLRLVRAARGSRPAAALSRDPLRRAVVRQKAVRLEDDGRLFPLRSTLCRQAYAHTDAYRRWCALFKAPPLFHRKQWEHFFICQALDERGLLGPGRRGLGFGVGEEPMPAVFARLGCDVLATDLDPEQAQVRGWAETDQHAKSYALLNQQRICPPRAFAERVRFRVADMTAIPADLTGFDFCWSACALEHLGSIRRGMDFVVASLDTLEPGGTAVHTTEFNLASDTDTLDNEATVLFRRRDLEALAAELTAQGHRVEPLDFAPGDMPLDAHVDAPPFRPEPHLRVALSRYVVTSFGLIVRKAG